MKNLILIAFLTVISIACNKKTDEIQNKNKLMNTNKIPQEKQLTYMLELNIKLPYELYINDIKADYDYIGANSGVDLNPYILKNGKYKIKIKIFPAFKVHKKLISIDDLKNSTIKFGHYIMDKEKDDIHSYNLDDFKLLNFTLPNKDVPYFEQEWEVEVKNLPYTLKGWSNGQDLSKMDQKKLKERVVNYYENLWNVLNKGEGERYIQLWKQADEELLTYDYENNLEELNNEEIGKINKYCLNNMLPMNDYEMKLYADGKLVSLEKNVHTNELNNKKPLDIFGWSPLIRLGQKAGASSYQVKLYLPKGSHEFVIIRK